MKVMILHPAIRDPRPVLANYPSEVWEFHKTASMPDGKSDPFWVFGFCTLLSPAWSKADAILFAKERSLELLEIEVADGFMEGLSRSTRDPSAAK